MTYYTGFRVGALRVTASGLIYFVVGAPSAASLGHANVVICAGHSGPRVEYLGQIDMFYSSREIA